MDETDDVQDRIYQLGQQIRMQRIAQKLSQKKLALMVNTDQAVIARIEAGKHNTGIVKYIEIADALDVPFNHLVKF
ncbi:helix-turn-helix transcriptional regulator [Adlercreutzia sp. R25]|uniref:Helix-turn-helix transcriptional regulator n=1 Tax=Adlercreutzia shanghongiae TaxID=3111773 RepID=A0ABU6IZM0_9ACTN|nr:MULTISPECIES: helix-turn-helix transcriptional regulator [unclassified Adlercreutzia]MEC4272984.1 helix-turn-helix transcriptional regulator [Adlercreutzia sp. R25]MEC4295225.1 helix-turn-helix transcriptional regulator [Adlercreutzia sp. R22]